MIFVDTNYFIRYLLDDIPTQSNQARELFHKASRNEVKLFTSTIVIFEIYWVFTKFYEKSRKEVGGILDNVLSMDFIKLDERNVLIAAVKLFSTSSLELEDCYNAIYSKVSKAKEFKTFDRKLNNYLKKKK